MLITNHVLQGAVIGALAPGPVSAFVAGVASHYAADSVPHFGVVEYDDFVPIAVVDGLVGLSVMTWLTRRATARRGTVLAGMLGACAPDSEKPTKLFFSFSPFPAALDRWHGAIQDESVRPVPPGGRGGLRQPAPRRVAGQAAVSGSAMSSSDWPSALTPRNASTSPPATISAAPTK